MSFLPLSSNIFLDHFDARNCMAESLITSVRHFFLSIQNNWSRFIYSFFFLRIHIFILASMDDILIHLLMQERDSLQQGRNTRIHTHYSVDALTCIHGMSTLFIISYFVQVPEHGRKLGISGQLISRHGAPRRRCRRRCGRGRGDNPRSQSSRRAARRCPRRACP